MSPRVHDGAPQSSASGEPYSPLRRTALLLTGTGSDGAYHAGVLRALEEAGVKIDVVAGRGIGAVGAMFAAVDGANRLWAENGFWRGAAVQKLYGWQSLFGACLTVFVLALAIVLVPLIAAAAGLLVFPIDFVLSLTGVTALNGLTAAYLELVQGWFAPEGLPTWLPRLALLTLGVGLAMTVLAAWLRTTNRRQRGPFWWRLMPAPLSSALVATRAWSVLWDLLRGAAPIKQPAPGELAARYAEVLADNLGQPGFRELLIGVHDIDAGRDLVFALVTDARRRDMLHRSTTREAEARRAEIVDLGGVSRAHLVDAIAAACVIPMATEPHLMTFAPESHWRGETHRLCDRPASIMRLVTELTELGVEQIVLVSASPEAAGPHTLARPRLDGRGRVGEYLRSSEAAMAADVLAQSAWAPARVFAIQPAHNPVGPLDFTGAFDDRSDRPLPLAELMARGYEDAYHQFIEPVLGASGEGVGEQGVRPAEGRRSRRA